MAETPKILLSLGSNKSLGRSHSNGTKRTHSALNDSDDDDGDAGKHQQITHFDASAGGGMHADRPSGKKAPLVIPVGENKRRKQTSALPSQNAQAAEAAAAEAKANSTQIQFGLNVQEETARAGPEAEVALSEKGTVPAAEPATERARTLDEQALDALLGKSKPSNTVIPALTDEETFQREYDEAPEAPTEADYAAVPIEDFGAAMLRGMGWKDGETVGKNRGAAPVKAKIPERRPELLGLGAKPAKALGIEIGEWGKHAKKNDKKLNQAYAPVMLRNKETGVMITEQEYQEMLKKESNGFIDSNDEAKKDRAESGTSKQAYRKNYSDEDRLHSRSQRDSDRDRRHRKERDREREHESSTYRSSRRDRSRSYEGSNHHSSRRERSGSYDNRRRHRHGDDDHERREFQRHRDRRDADTEDKSRSRGYGDESRHKDRNHRFREEDRSYRKE